MNANEQLIKRFYSAFQKKDFAEMQSCYGDTATFSDAVFQNLNAQEVKAMWEMLCINGRDLQLEFKDIWADEKSGRADWVATYTFSATGRRVVNRISATFGFKDGRIILHNDVFNFYTWARQALGALGLLLGWTWFIRSKIQTKARANLTAFMAKEALKD